MTKRKFYKTTFMVTVLSDEPGYGDRANSLAEIGHDITCGDFTGTFTIEGTAELDGKQAVKALCDVGSDPGFFGLTEDGEDETTLEKGDQP